MSLVQAGLKVVRWMGARFILPSFIPFFFFFFTGSMREAVFRDHVTQTFTSKAGNREFFFPLFFRLLRAVAVLLNFAGL